MFHYNNINLTIYLIILFAAIIFVVFPTIINFYDIRNLLKQRKLWESLNLRLNELTLEIIQDLPEPTRFVLNCVLTDRPGIGNSQAIPGALGHLEAVLESPLRAIRSRSYLSVLLGLLGTVFVLAITFWGTQDIKDIKPDLLSHIYSVNLIAITFAVIIYMTYISFRYSSDQFLLLASQILGGLHAEIPEGVDPRLLSALEMVGQRFTQWAEDILIQYRGHSERLVEEMQALGGALREMVQNMLAAQKTEVEGIIPLLRSQDEKIELLSQRLDERFQDLARPLSEALSKALPLLDAWRQRTEELKQAVQEMRQSDLEGKTSALAQATEILIATVKDLPQAAREHFRGVKRELSGGLGQALRETWKELILPCFQELNSHLTEMKERHQALEQAIDRLPASISSILGEKMPSSLSEAMEPAIKTLDSFQGKVMDSLQNVDHSIERLSDTLKQRITTSLSSLTEINSDIKKVVNNLLENMERLQEIPQKLSDALQESLRGVGANFSNAVFHAIHQVWQQPRPPESSLLDTLRMLMEEQQKQVRHLEKLNAQLDVHLEALGDKIAEKISQNIHNLQARSDDGHLRDILTTLRDMQAVIRKATHESMTGQDKSWWPFGKK
ncbi:MAG: hypothetical protein QXT73_02680 [Candidatus Methanomethylicaceae archaeon]